MTVELPLATLLAPDTKDALLAFKRLAPLLIRLKPLENGETCELSRPNPEDNCLEPDDKALIRLRRAFIRAVWLRSCEIPVLSR